MRTIADWLTFLKQNGAYIEGEAVRHFGDPPLEIRTALHGDIISDLSHFGLIRVEGDDAQSFLQGQFTNDVRQVSDDHSQLSAYCNPKGRMLASFRLFRRENSYYLRLPAETLAATIDRLRKYVLMSKVTLSDAGNDLARFGISGPHCIERLEHLVGPVAKLPDQVTHAKGVTLVRVPGPHPRFEIYGEPSALEPLWTALSRDFCAAGAPAWSLLDIHAGLPTLLTPNVEAFVPQMVNLTLVGGVSFQKGCYPGQEIVARMQYLGKLKRRMYLAHVESDRPPQPGDELLAPDSESGQGAGRVVDAQPAPAGGYDLLAVVEIASREGEDVRLDSAEGPRLTFYDLPYPFAAE